MRFSASRARVHLSGRQAELKPSEHRGSVQLRSLDAAEKRPRKCIFRSESRTCGTALRYPMQDVCQVTTVNRRYARLETQRSRSGKLCFEPRSVDVAPTSIEIPGNVAPQVQLGLAVGPLLQVLCAGHRRYLQAKLTQCDTNDKQVLEYHPQGAEPGFTASSFIAAVHSHELVEGLDLKRVNLDGGAVRHQEVRVRGQVLEHACKIAIYDTRYAAPGRPKCTLQLDCQGDYASPGIILASAPSQILTISVDVLGAQDRERKFGMRLKVPGVYCSVLRAFDPHIAQCRLKAIARHEFSDCPTRLSNHRDQLARFQFDNLRFVVR